MIETQPKDDSSPSSPKSFEASDGVQLLERVKELAEELGSSRIADEAGELAGRVSEGRFFLACIGQFKRGKSSLINALIGEAVLPSGFIPVTTVPTVVRFAGERKARIRRQNGAWQEIPLSDLSLYASEEHNPENSKGIAGVEVFVPAPLLADGMCLVDTPGLGSVFLGNTATTQDFLPRIDAALVVIGADPPIAGEELKLVEAVGNQARKLIVVLNKADRTTDAERAAAVKFTRRLLEKHLHRPAGPFFEVSALERIEARGPERDWNKLILALQELGQGSAHLLVQEACVRGLRRLGEQLLAIVAEEREALRRPIADSERRVSAIRETIALAERSMRELGFLFMAEQQRLSDVFVRRHKTFLGSALPRAQRELEKGIQGLGRGAGPAYRQSAMHIAQSIVQELVLPWLLSEQAEAEREYRQVTLRFVQLGNDFLKKLAEAGVGELGRMPHALEADTGFQVRSRFAFHDLIEVAEPASPLRWLADLFLGAVRAHRVIDRSAHEFLIQLLEINSSRVQSDILNRVQESRSRLEAEIRKLLHEVALISQQALVHARAAQEAGAPAVQKAVERLESIEDELSKLKPAL
jgi:GTP-binding protein EngB required for normal cell division